MWFMMTLRVSTCLSHVRLEVCTCVDCVRTVVVMVITRILAFVFLHEEFIAKSLIGC